MTGEQEIHEGGMIGARGDSIERIGRFGTFAFGCAIPSAGMERLAAACEMVYNGMHMIMTEKGQMDGIKRCNIDEANEDISVITTILTWVLGL